MGIIKFVAKSVGTVVLGATGIATGIVSKAADTVGFELGSELFGAAENASFNGIKNMWGSSSSNTYEEYDGANETNKEIKELWKRRSRKLSEATKCREFAQAAKKAENEEKYEFFMQRYEVLRAEADAYLEEIHSIESSN